MTIKDKDFYNEASAAKLGWSPSWFGASDFDDELVEAIKKFQTKYGLPADGLCGQQTFKLIFTEQESKRQLLMSQLEKKKLKIQVPEKHIVCGSTKVVIDWNLVKLENFNILSSRKRNKKPNLIVVHWDAALSSKSAIEIMKKRGVSAHFSIDNDGTIYQLVNCDDIAYHAKGFNEESIGIEVSNAVYLNFQGHYEKIVGQERPIVKNAVAHGEKHGDVLGFYPAQIEALKSLLKTLCSYYQIPLEVPIVDGKLVSGTFEPILNKRWGGISCHYHNRLDKWDCAGLELDKIVEDIKNKK